MNEEHILKIDYEGKSHEAIAGVSIFRTNPETGKREVLLVKGKKSGQWYFPGGKIRDGEDPVAAVRRELTEELGVGFTGSLIVQDESVGHYHFGEKDLAIANFVLDGELDGDPSVQKGDNVEEFQWFADPLDPALNLKLTLQARNTLEEQIPHSPQKA